MKRVAFVLIIMALCTWSCNKSTVYRNIEKTNNLEWLKGETQEFEFDIIDDTSTYDVFITFRYAQGYQFEKVIMNVSEKTPIDEKIIPHNIKVRNKNGSYIGEGSGDIWDIESLLYEDIKLSKGAYTYKIKHEMPVDKLQMVMSVGMIVKKR